MDATGHKVEKSEYSGFIKERDEIAAPFVIAYIWLVIAWLVGVLAWIFWYRGYP